MSCDFKPGDEVVCVDASPGPEGVPCPLRLGAIYVIRDVKPPVLAVRWPRVLVEGVQCPDVLYIDDNGTLRRTDGFSPFRFRKVERKTDKLSLTEWLSQPAGDTDRLDKTRPAKTRERA